MSTTADLHQLFQKARLRHSSGDIAGALQIYRQLLERQPKNTALLNLCGQSEMQLGRHHEAMGLFVRSLQVNEKQPDVWYFSGRAAMHLRKYPEAIRYFSQALEQNDQHAAACTQRALAFAAMGALPRAMKDLSRAIEIAPDGERYYNRGTIYLRLNRFAAAVADFDQALEFAPGYLEALVNRGIARQGLERPELALEDFRQAIAVSPACAVAHAEMGKVLRGLGRVAEALAAYDAALALDQADAATWEGRGQCLMRLERIAEAKTAFDHALTLQPENAGYHNNLAVVLRRLNQPEAALTVCEAALALDGGNYRIHLNHGQILQVLQRPEDAVAAFDRCTELEPYCHDAWADRGRVLLGMEKFPEAAGSFGRALAITPTDGMSWCNHGSCWVRMNRAEEARYDFQMAQICAPDNVEIRWNAALGALSCGDYAIGWPLYEARLSRPPLSQFVRRFDGPRWDGTTPVAGSRLLLYAEQGAGDVMQFCRYVPPLAAAGAHIILMAQDGLIPLLKSLAGVEMLLPLTAETPDHDLQSPLMSLPLAFQNAGWPAPTPEGAYLRAPQARAADRAAALKADARPQIGLVVSGAPGHANDHNRSMALSALAPVLNLPGRFHLLQPEIRPDDLAFAKTQPGLIRYPDLNDYAETAALVAGLDLVITVDSSVAHLAGAIGKPVWILLPHAADWRWGARGEATHWYPSARLFRQPGPGNWADVAGEVAEQLKKRIFPADTLC